MKTRKPLAIFSDEHGPANAFHSYRRGWTDGARATAKSETDTTQWYLYGYNDGYEARKKMNAYATELTGYSPSPLRERL